MNAPQPLDQPEELEDFKHEVDPDTILPVVFLTHDRTTVARECLKSLVANLECKDRQLVWLLCSDRSAEGHVEALFDVLERHGVPKDRAFALLTTKQRHGLGASMNNGILHAMDEAGLGCDVCLRTEDDWLLKRPLDLTPFVDAMTKGSGTVGCIRMGMMFRDRDELLPFSDHARPDTNGLLYRVKSKPGRTMTFNNQIALVSSAIYDLCGLYDENAKPEEVEQNMAVRYNRATAKGASSPFVCWPVGWATNKEQDDRLPFAHVGESTIGHRFEIPKQYRRLNDREADMSARRMFS